MNTILQSMEKYLPPSADDNCCGESSAEIESASFAGSAGFDTEDEGQSLDFPLDCLPPILKEYLSYLTQHLSFDPAIAAPTILSSLSAAIGKGLKVQSGPTRFTNANLFVLVAAKSGTGKSQAFHDVMTPLHEAEARLIDEWSNTTAPTLRVKLAQAQREATLLRKPSSKNFNSERAVALEKEIASLTNQLVPPQLFIGDVTREALAERLANAPHEVLSSFSPEAGGLLEVLGGRYHSGSTDEDIYLSAYSGESYRVNRKSSAPINLKRPWLSLHWMTQPDKLQKFLSDPRLANSGFFQRCLVAITDRAPQPEEWREDDRPAKPAEPAKLWAAINHVLLKCYRSVACDPLTVSPSQQARTSLLKFTNSVIQRRGFGGDLADMDSYAARWGENTWKIALLLHAARHLSEAQNHQLAVSTAEAAIAISSWFAEHQQKLLAPARNSLNEDLRLKVVTRLQHTEGGVMTLRDMERRHCVQIHELKRIAQLFPSELECLEIRNPKGGRPSEIVRLKQL